jgi:hypothetical protein
MTARSIRLQLSEDETRALHSAVEEAIAANLLPAQHKDTARTVLDRLARRVPDWLARAPVGGEAGYLMAADAVLRALVDAEQRGRDALADTELAHALGDAKPVGVTIDHVLRGMERDKLIRGIRPRNDGSTWFSAARAGRQWLASTRNGSTQSAEWAVDDTDGLMELIFREHRPGREAYRPFVQAIGRLSDERFEALANDLRTAGLLEPVADAGRLNTLTLTDRGARLAEERVRATLPPHAYLWALPAPPLPYVRGLPLIATRDDRECTCRHGHAAWLQSSSRTKLHATIRRVGVAEWECRWCYARWLIYLLGYGRDGEPAYARPEDATHVRPAWHQR